MMLQIRRSGLPIAACLCAISIQALVAQEPTRQDRDRAVAELRASRKMFLDSLSGLSKEQLNFKPDPGRWSVLECAEHIALAEDGYFDLITKRLLKTPADPAKKSEVRGKEDYVLKTMVDRTAKRIAPETLQPGRHGDSIDAIVAHFEASRQRFIQYIETTHDDLRGHFLPHRAVGLIDGYQWILLASGHSVRHTLQILEVKADPRFPKK
jgi:hypothetical protein